VSRGFPRLFKNQKLAERPAELSDYARRPPPAGVGRSPAATAWRLARVAASTRQLLVNQIRGLGRCGAACWRCDIASSTGNLFLEARSQVTQVVQGHFIECLVGGLVMIRRLGGDEAGAV